MKHHIALLCLFTIVALLATCEAKKKRKPGTGRHAHRKPQPIPDTSVYNENELNEISDSFNELDAFDEYNHGFNEKPKIYDPCRKRHCSAGQICKLTDDGEPTCVCIEECPKETDPRRKVCSNLNDTWGSDCELNQMRCWCEEDDQKCQDVTMAHHHIDYFGSCRVIEDCTSDQMVDFPRRMRDWLFHIMRDMADRDELSTYYQKLERKAETNHTRRWAIAAVWKWCHLDAGHDRSVSRHELFPIRAPLVAMEHCIAPFLNSCDVNDDHKISLQEWTHCLQLDEDEIEEECEEIRESSI